MKKILYIVNNHKQDWTKLISTQGVDSACVLVKRDLDSEAIVVPKKYFLRSSTTKDEPGTISYQELLEEIFSSDLPVVM